MKQNKKRKIKGCACYGVNSIHPCFCSPFSNKDKKPLKGDSALCSGCNTKQGTVDRNMFDGLCADCTDKALYDYEFAKKAQIRNEELKGHFA
jgi:hypothetical protein